MPRRAVRSGCSNGEAMQIDVMTWYLHRDIAEAIDQTWQRLPASVKAQLGHVRFTVGATPPYRGCYADAGHDDVCIYRLPPTTDAAVAVICHELGHVAGNHHARIQSGALSRDAAEIEADAIARQWGFGRELSTRQLLLGR